MSDTLDAAGPADADMAAGLLDAARNFFSLTERGFDFFGYDTAAENLRRYRSGQGGLEEYSNREIERHPALLEAEDTSRTRFESFTFTGRTKVAPLGVV
ncbi:hypothetical protein [Siccirubricoccus sp. G192]|uniref:hypothetical protein n=1 Tax=Siccirubricoccus sp. G192 TaxID=2849651 RepID=UPI001C2C16D0|nr:hypothetical protein [Siccirubricoccus sp. G192]MBV1799656.1 hypothetical protein [Siccirubricoccus sp. G192]